MENQKPDGIVKVTCDIDTAPIMKGLDEVEARLLRLQEKIDGLNPAFDIKKEIQKQLQLLLDYPSNDMVNYDTQFRLERLLQVYATGIFSPPVDEFGIDKEEIKKWACAVPLRGCGTKPLTGDTSQNPKDAW